MQKALPEIRNQAGLFCKVHLTKNQVNCKIDFTFYKKKSAGGLETQL
ncbi:hypothetical protein SAMN03080598_01518 [Algoriphagus boritolerans DSM 17298 = JCM 18970]|uniref:Uncharacterized protein n=1 Tax=Algoriphagus boritolerans DSM 17298 = JCM 18970 TaxID=1120964 RepID=A0A1H5V4T1_9BACT|nr:hypothetical protein SAMN03080598_01518 [Algoriphagus boritolerans DSM 17298 = JCM 18970]